jgi:hypothetical protein
MFNVHTYVRFTYKQNHFKPLKLGICPSKMFSKENLWGENYVNTHITA